MMPGVADFVANFIDRKGEPPWLTILDRSPKTKKSASP